MNVAGELHLKPGKERSLQRRHPWVYGTAVAAVHGRPKAGDLVAVRAKGGDWLAWAAYAPASTLRARCWSFAETDSIDAAWFGARIAESVQRRSSLSPSTSAMRLVFGEADRLPGFVADRYADQLVVQLQSCGAEAQRDVLLDALLQVTSCKAIFDRSDSATRKREGLAPAFGAVRGPEPADFVEVHEHGLRFKVDVRRGHKTGFYIDQRNNRRLAQDLAARLSRELGMAPRVLNCFCYTGAFSLAMHRGGGGEAWSVDASRDALEIARVQWEANGFAASSGRWEEADVFEALRELRAGAETFDLIVLDPPKFAASHHHVERAARAYKDINLNALRLLRPRGHLLTFSCSGAIDVGLFQKIVAGAVIDAGVDCQLVGRLSAGEDHPMSMVHPEGEYLKGLLLRRM